MATLQKYSLPQIIYEDTQIITDSFKTTCKMDVEEEYTRSNSYSPYTIYFSNQTKKWEIINIDPTNRSFLEDMMDR